MKYLIALLFMPFLIIPNALGAIWALIAAGFVNGYIKMMELLSDAQEERKWDE